MRRRPQMQGGGKTLLHRLTVVLPIVEGWLAADYGASDTKVEAGGRDEGKNTRVPEIGLFLGVRSNEFAVEELMGFGASDTKLQCELALR
jgi:hypothetical protein